MLVRYHYHFSLIKNPYAYIRIRCPAGLKSHCGYDDGEGSLDKVMGRKCCGHPDDYKQVYSLTAQVQRSSAFVYGEWYIFTGAIREPRAANQQGASRGLAQERASSEQYTCLQKCQDWYEHDDEASYKCPKVFFRRIC